MAPESGSYNRAIKAAMVDLPAPGSPGWADQGCQLSGCYIEIYIREYRLSWSITEVNFLKCDLTSETMRGTRRRKIPHFGCCIQDFADAFVSYSCFGIRICDLGKVLHRLIHFPQVPDEDD